MSAETHTVRIGRAKDSDLVLTHVSVSRRHAELMIGPDGSLEIRDLESTGGTFILRDRKEQPVTTARLKWTDSLRFGDYEISVEDLLSLARGTPQGEKISSASKTNSVEDVERPKTRMVRCACGTIKERDKVCPACGT